MFPAAWPKVVEHVQTVSPDTMMLPGPDGCLNPGEGGGGDYPIINYVNSTIQCSYRKAADPDSIPSIYGTNYVPYESDLSIQNPGDAWFYHEGHPFLTGAQLWTHYLATVGRGSHWILNVPPNASGLVPEGFVEAVSAVGDAVRKSFETSVGGTTAPVTAKCSELSVTTTVSDTFDAIVIVEDLTSGQAVLGFVTAVVSAHASTPRVLDCVRQRVVRNHHRAPSHASVFGSRATALC